MFTRHCPLCNKPIDAWAAHRSDCPYISHAFAAEEAMLARRVYRVVILPCCLISLALATFLAGLWFFGNLPQ